LQVIDLNKKKFRADMPYTKILHKVVLGVACLGMPGDLASMQDAVIGVKAHVRIWDHESTSSHVSNHSFVPAPVGTEVVA
jgi:hypothetical protein